MTRTLRAPGLLAVLVTVLCGGCLSLPVAPPPVAAVATDVEPAGFAADRTSALFHAATIGVPVPSPVAPQSVTDLAELQHLAFETSPALKQAAADVAAARGAALQAGLHPNPTVGYQGDQIGSGHTAGQQGAFLSQTIVTRGKLGLAQAAALAEVTRAELALQQAQADLQAEVRARYFALRTAAEAVRVAEQMAGTAGALAARQQKLLDSGQPVAPHEVDQARALAAAARGELLQARNRHTAAGKQLAVLVGSPSVSRMDPNLAIEAVPAYSFDHLQRMLDGHTEVRAAAAQVERARIQLDLARVTPYPNLETNTYVQRDYQTRTAQFGLQVGVALPVFDRNQGNIAEAEARLVRATHEAARVRQELGQRLAESFERYSTNRRLLDQYRDEILPAQVKAFDGIRKRFEQEPGRVSFSEVVLAQQTLSHTSTAYLNVLAAAWQAVAELGRLAQSDEPAPGLSGGADSWPEPIAPKP